MSNKILRVFLETDMRCQHPGLRLVALKEKVNLDLLEQGEHVIFINTALNRIKMYSPGNVLSYIYKSSGKVDLRYISAFSQAFGSNGKFDYDKAVKETLIKKLGLKTIHTKPIRAHARANAREQNQGATA